MAEDENAFQQPRRARLVQVRELPYEVTLSMLQGLISKEPSVSAKRDRRTMSGKPDQR